MQQTLPEQFSSKLIIHTLELTRSGRSTAVGILASHARCTSEVAKRILNSLKVNIENGQVSLSTEARLRLAREASRGGFLGDVARTLEWQEFESFTEACLDEAGYKVQKNVRTREEGRVREVDIVAARGNLVLCIDCKHWNTPSYPSKFTRALEHQLEATYSLLRELRRKETGSLLGLPVVLTLLEPREKLRNGVVLLSIDQLSDFTENLAPFSESLPFISAGGVPAENPIKGP